MSLINDALRRADMDTRQGEAGAETSEPPPLPPEPPVATKRRRSPWVVLLGVALVVLVGVVAYGAWWGVGAARKQAGLALKSATAALDEAAEKAPSTGVQPNTPAPPRSLAMPMTPKAAAQLIARAKTLAAQAQAKTEAQRRRAELAMREAEFPDAMTPADTLKTPNGVGTGTEPEGDAPATVFGKGPHRPVDPSVVDDLASGMLSQMVAGLGAAVEQAANRTPDFDEDDPATTPPATPATPAETDPRTGAPEAEDETSPATPPAKTRPKAPAATSPKKPAVTPSAPAKTAPRKTTPAKAKPVTPPAPIDTSAFKITSIMVGSGRGLAIINGRPIREGDTIAGAKVVRITSRAVEIEVDGRRATIGM